MFFDLEHALFYTLLKSKGVSGKVFITVLLLMHLLGACPAEGRVSSDWGYRKDPMTTRKRFHRGVDIANIEGTPIRSIHPGRVMRTRNFEDGYGSFVVVQTGEVKFLYGHLSKIKVKPGQKLLAGSVLGEMGHTGRATGNHLHLATWIADKKSFNPNIFIWGCYERQNR